MIISIGHRYVCDVANNIKLTNSDNPKKCCKNCYNSKISPLTINKTYICPILSKLAYEANPLSGEYDVKIQPYCVCSKWKKKKK